LGFVCRGYSGPTRLRARPAYGGLSVHPRTPGGCVGVGIRWRGAPIRCDFGWSAAAGGQHRASVHRSTVAEPSRALRPAEGVNRCVGWSGGRAVSRLGEETIDRVRRVHVPVLLGASGMGYPGGGGSGRGLAPVRDSSAALARHRGRPLLHGSPTDTAGPPPGTYRIRLATPALIPAHA